LAGVGEEAATAAHAGVVEEQVHVVGLVPGEDLVAEALDSRLVAHVADVAGDDHAGAGLLLGEPHRLGHRLAVDVAAGHRAALGGALADELAAHPAPRPGHHGQPALEAIHASPRRFVCGPNLTGGATPLCPGAAVGLRSVGHVARVDVADGEDPE